MWQQRRSRPCQQCGHIGCGSEHKNDCSWEQKRRREGRTCDIAVFLKHYTKDRCEEAVVVVLAREWEDRQAVGISPTERLKLRALFSLR